jgi:hypothetical protein
MSDSPREKTAIDGSAASQLYAHPVIAALKAAAPEQVD